MGSAFSKTNSVIYDVSVITGKRKGAGTDANVFLTIIGTTGRTSRLRLDKPWENDHETGTQRTYRLFARDVGKLLMIELGHDQKGLFSDWFVELVTISCSHDSGRVYEFPCGHWVQRSNVTFESKALLVTDKQSEAVRKQRKKEVQQRQQLFQWGDDPKYIHLPGYLKGELKNLPKDVQFTSEDSETLVKSTVDGAINDGLESLLSTFDSWNDFEDYRRAFRVFVGDVPLAADHWRDDSFYGTHYLNGCNPEIIKRCTEIPSKFPVTQELVGNLLDEGDTLQGAIEDGRVYMVDLEILEGIPCYDEKGRRYVCPALGLFYVKGSGRIVPIAIQFHQDPSETNPIWTPNDSEIDWIYAKMWLKNADSQWHQMIAHLLRCHLCMEPFAVASWRQLPSIHPVWKLLKPHIVGIIAINTLGREKLISPGGLADRLLSIGGGGHIELMKKYFRTLNMSSYDLPQVLKDRGVDDPEKLPHFYYREDALKLWDAIKDFVSKMLSIYYQSDKDIEKDSELQASILDLHDNGYPIREGESDHGIPSSVKTAAQLSHLLTIIIFTSSCQHAAVNFSQMDTYGFVPNSPLLMRQPPPTQKGKVTEKDIMHCLPNNDETGLTVLTMFDLTRFFPDVRFLGDYSGGAFRNETKARDAILHFQENLQRLSRSIKERNETLEFPYIYLLPERVPNSIDI